MSILLRSFLRGLLFVVPIGATIYILYLVLSWIDNLIDPEAVLGIDHALPGLGIALTVVLITGTGFLTSLFLTRWAVGLVERFFARMPIAKLLYSAIKDLMEAFVGEKKKFDRPVIVSLELGGKVCGFITSEDLGWLGQEGQVAVYFPQSYNFAGQVAIFPREKVSRIDAEPSAVLQFVVSGGVSRTFAPAK